jgi:hypothetical protein
MKIMWALYASLCLIMVMMWGNPSQAADAKALRLQEQGPRCKSHWPRL